MGSDGSVSDEEELESEEESGEHEGDTRSQALRNATTLGRIIVVPDAERRTSDLIGYTEIATLLAHRAALLAAGGEPFLAAEVVAAMHAAGRGAPHFLAQQELLLGTMPLMLEREVDRYVENGTPVLVVERWAARELRLHDQYKPY